MHLTRCALDVLLTKSIMQIQVDNNTNYVTSHFSYLRMCHLSDFAPWHIDNQPASVDLCTCCSKLWCDCTLAWQHNCLTTWCIIVLSFYHPQYPLAHLMLMGCECTRGIASLAWSPHAHAFKIVVAPSFRHGTDSHLRKAIWRLAMQPEKAYTSNLCKIPHATSHSIQ